MINVVHKTLILLLRSAITGECLQLPDKIDLNMVFSEAKRHQVSSMAYAGAVNCGVDKSCPEMKAALNLYYAEFMRSERQLNSVNLLCAALDKAKIDHLLLKGARLKLVYPKPEMRKMNDADILIKEKDFDKAREVAESLGYSVDDLSADHTKNFRSDELYLEYHVRLVARNEFPKCAEYFDSGWKFARKVEGHLDEMTPEAEFIFIFVHFLKHFISSGIGCKQLCDLWVFLEKYKTLDLTWVEEELEKLELHDFYKNLTNTINVWFKDADGDEKTDLISEYVLECGTWGTERTRAMGASIRSKKKVKNSRRIRLYTLLKSIFPEFREMKKQYPVLERHPYLLPFVWCGRLLRVVVVDRWKVTRKIDEIKLVSTENIETHEQKMHFIGADSLK